MFSAPMVLENLPPIGRACSGSGMCTLSERARNSRCIQCYENCQPRFLLAWNRVAELCGELYTILLVRFAHQDQHVFYAVIGIVTLALAAEPSADVLPAIEMIRGAIPANAKKIGPNDLQFRKIHAWEGISTGRDEV